jgi:Protein of unknown function (DUF4446)
VDLGTDTTSTLVVVALGVAVLALVIAVGGYLRLSGIQARYRILWAGGEKDLVAVLSHQSDQIVHLHGELERIRSRVAQSAGDVGQSLRHVSVVRYDAFGDMAGQLSFSAAIIDDHGDGLVISSIHARGESRSYAKGVVGGIGEVTLTPQEQQALAAARTGKGSV